jgi:hypothetical protein
MPSSELSPASGPVTVEQPVTTNPAGVGTQENNIQAPDNTNVNGTSPSTQDQDTKKKADEKKSKAGRVMRDRLERIVRAWNAMRARQASNRLDARADDGQTIPVDY